MEDTHPALSELRSATRMLHDQLEATLPVAADHAGREEFLHYLQDMRGWLSGFEARLWSAAWPQEMCAAQRAGKLDWIESDLRAAGMSASAVAALPDAGYRPAFDTMASRYGVAYVIEGAQLGTRVLSRRLAPVLGAWSPRWLEGYGDDMTRYWRSFIQCAERALVTQDARREAAAAAADAFASLAAWFALRRQERAGGMEWCAASDAVM